MEDQNRNSVDGISVGPEQIDDEMNFPNEFYQETFEARAIVRSKLSKLLLRHPVGHFLVRNGVFTHPVLKEKDRQIAAYRRLKVAFGKSALLENPTDLEFISSEPDMLPSTLPEIAIQKGIQRHTVDSLEYKLSMNSFENIDEMNYKVGFPPDLEFRTDGSELAEQAVDAVRGMQVIANELYYRALRDKVLELAGKMNWPLLVEMFYHLHAVPELNAALTDILEIVGKKLFARPDFRKQMAYFMIRQISIHNLTGHENFSNFLLANNFPPITEEEKIEFLNHQYQGRLLENMRYLNPKKYFYLVETLYRYGLITNDFLRHSHIFKFHVIEFALKAFYGHDDFAALVNQVRPLVAEIGIFQPEELSLNNQHSLYGHYKILCSTLNKSSDRVITSLYRKDNHAQKWEE